MAEPFTTLLSENSRDSNSSQSFDDLTPLSTPASATHDTSRVSFHVKDLETFAKNLQTAADRAFPNEGRRQTRYGDVSVLLLRWQDDEMNVEWELDDLEKIFIKYGFTTERWLIPRKNAHLKLMSKAVEVVEQHERDDGREDLVIIYYAGHAFINSARQATWSCNTDPSYASLEWSAIQTLFEKAHFDVLLLLDCCAAASAAPSIGSAVTETIAACGFESIAPQPGRYSFSNTLIEVLEDWIDNPPFSAAMLHNKVLTVLKHERPERAQNGLRRILECRRTPIHIVATSNPRLPSIELGRRILSKECLQASVTHQPTKGLKNPPYNPPSESASATDQPGYSSPRKRKQLHPETSEESNDEDCEAPRVIISLALERHQSLTSTSCQKWLASCPTIVRYAKVEAVFKGFSALVILSIPVSIWDLLPEDPACSFIGYVTSHNLLRYSLQNQGLLPESEKESVSETTFVKKARHKFTSKVQDSEQDSCETNLQCPERSLSTKYKVETNPKYETSDTLVEKFHSLPAYMAGDSDEALPSLSSASSYTTAGKAYSTEALQARSAVVQHESSPEEIRSISIQEEREKLSGSSPKSEVRVSALEEQRAVSNSEVILLSKGKTRLEAQVTEQKGGEADTMNRGRLDHSSNWSYEPDFDEQWISVPACSLVQTRGQGSATDVDEMEVSSESTGRDRPFKSSHVAPRDDRLTSDAHGPRQDREAMDHISNRRTSSLSGDLLNSDAVEPDWVDLRPEVSIHRSQPTTSADPTTSEWSTSELSKSQKTLLLDNSDSESVQWVSADPSGRELQSQRPQSHGTFQDQQSRDETSNIRKLKACVRCRMQKIRCQTDNNDPGGICVTCQGASKQKIHTLPCFRYKLTECTLYRTGKAPGLEFTLRWPVMKLKDISDWADPEVRTIKVVSNVCDVPLELSVRKFVPIPQDSLQRSWMDGQVKKFKKTTPYSIVNMSATVKDMRDYINRHVFQCMELWLRNRDTWVQDTYKFARQYMITAPPEEASLLADFFRLWFAVQRTATTEHIIGDDNLDMEPVNDLSYKQLYAKIPLPPVMIQQLDMVLTLGFLQPLRKKVLGSFQKIVLNNKPKSWMTIYLITFMSLHSCATLTAENYDNARKHGLKRRFAIPIFISERHHSANVFLSHYHYCTKPCDPFTIDKGWCERQKTPFPEMTVDEIDFLLRTKDLVNERKDKFSRIQRFKFYEDELYFVSQMFEEDWTPRDTIIEYSDETIYGVPLKYSVSPKGDDKA